VNLTSAWRKYERGIEQARELCGKARAFEEAKAYVPNVKTNVRSAQEVEYVVLADERATPPADLALLAGEVVYNLRSALDHAIYALMNKNRGQSQYPIFTDMCEFQVKGRPMIKGVPPTICALIEERQPYKHMATAPALDPLAILNSFSNRDKHRQLATVATAADFTYVGHDSEVAQITEWIQPLNPGRVLHQDAEIARFIAAFQNGIDEMNVKPDFTYEVRIQGRKLIHDFRWISNGVFEALIECETGQPVSFTQQGYPAQTL
jgi:hypothetical protein